MANPLADDNGERPVRPQDIDFNAAYSRPEPAYGTHPSPWLDALLRKGFEPGHALDLGSGAGRNSLAMARAGFAVEAIDRSSAGIARLNQASRQEGTGHLIHGEVRDIRDMAWVSGRYRLIVAATILDHLPFWPTDELPRVWQSLRRVLESDGYLYIEVHTTEDPGSPIGRGADCSAPASETAGHVQRYFRPNELLWMCREHLRVMRYMEQREWDQSHGHPHRHGKAYLLATPR